MPLAITPQVTSVNKSGSTALNGAVTLSQGTNITLTQSGQDISIAASVLSPGGSSTQIQYNNGSTFGGAEFTYWDNTYKGLILGTETTSISPIYGNPRKISSNVSSVSVGDDPYSLFVQGRYIYVTANRNNSLDVYAIKDEGTINQISTYTTANNSPTKVWIAGDYGYIIDNDGNKVDIVDVRNPAATAHLATLTPADPAKDIIARGKYLYVLVGSNGAIEVTDVSDPTSPKYIGSVSTINNDPLAMAIQNNFIVTVDATNDALEVFNLDDPAVPVFDGSVALTDGDVTDVDVQGRYAYVVGGTYLEVIDLGDSTVPTSITTFNLARPATSIKVYGGYAYVGNDQGVQIINIHDVGSPFHYESYESDPTFDLQVVGRLMYVVNNTPKLEIWDNGSAYLQQLEAGSVEVSTLAVRKNFEANEGVFKGGLTVAGTLNLEGGFALSGSGTSNYLPIWTGATTIGNSEITQASGVLSLLNGTSNRITWGTNGVAVPGTNSAGNKLTLYGSNVAASYSIGVENGFMWFSNDQTVAGTGFKWYAAGATEVFRVAGNSRVGILLSGNPSYELSLGGNVAKTIGMERHTTSNTAGTSLTINSGGATSGATNKASGDLNLNTGIGTGNSTPARVYVKTPTISGTSGTTDQTLIDRAVFANYKTLTSGVATTLFQVGTATNGTQAGGIIFYTISVTDGTDFITESGIVGYTNNNKAGVYTGATSILGTAAVSKSDATDTIVTTFGMSSDNLQCTSTITGQTPTTFRITFNIFNNANQTSTPP